MTTTSKLIRKAELKTNCPECYTTDGLMVEFYQPYVNGRWYKRFLDELSSKMYCTKCETEIFPVSWTPDIERVYDYHKKSTKMRSSKRHWKPLAFIVMLTGIALVATAVVFGLNYLS
jgi:hypothetical protein